MSTAAPLQTAKAKPHATGTAKLVMQRKCACGAGASSLTGECEECGKKKRLGLQTNLRICEPGDIYEQEADRIADQVMTTPALSAVSGAPPRIQGFRRQTNGYTDAAPASVDRVIASPGEPLEPVLREDMEQRFGHDFSNVRVHVSSSAELSAREVNAEAYTVGHSIVFGAGRFAPESHAGRRLIAHELTHVVQQSGMDSTRVGQSDHRRGEPNIPVLSNLQPSFPPSGMALQRKPVKRPDLKPVPALAPLEVVAQEAAKLVLKSYAAEKIPAGPVLTAVLDERTGKIYIGLNSGIPPEVADVVAKAIVAQKERTEKGEVIVVRTDPLAQGGHSETNAVNEAVRAREALLKRKVTEEELRTFELHNVWLRRKGQTVSSQQGERTFSVAPRCEHCARITRSVSVTSAVFFAEGGVSGTIKKPPTGGYRAPRVGPGGATGSISGTVDPKKPRTSPTPAPPTTAPPTQAAAKTGGQTPAPPPKTTSPTTASKGSSTRNPISPTSVAPAAYAVADLLSIIFGPYLFPDAEENYKKQLQDLQSKVQPTIEARITELLKSETPRIAGLGKRSNDLFITVKLAHWTQASDVPGVPALLVSIILEDAKLSTNNINAEELSHSLGDAARCSDFGHCKKYHIYSIPVSPAIRQEAERQLRGVGASDLKRFNYLADNLKASSEKVRIAGVLNMYKLVKDIGSLRGPAAQQLIPILRDPEANLRGLAAMALKSLDATEAIPFIRQALAETTDRNAKNAIQKSLDELEGIQKGSK